MLHPDNRSVLLEALRPPEGFVADQAIATTFTLDLTAVLIAPLAFSRWDGMLSKEPRKAGASTGESVDPFALLKSVREHAERLTVFCHKAYITSPARYQPLFVHLERSVVEMNAATREGLFHPKVWVLRFTEESGTEIRYRFLCASRNLTFDRAWDTIVMLDGTFVERRNAIAVNRPLAEFVRALPDLAVSPMDPKRKRSVQRMADELLTVKFELPENVTELRFHPLGIDGHRGWPFEERMDRVLVISPFLGEETLKRFGKAGRKDVLVSRIECLQQLPRAALERFGEHHVLSGAAELEDLEDEVKTSGEMAAAAASGLHAKVYVTDEGWNAHVWVGSANATTAGFEQNVEFLVQLTGKKKDLGVQATLDGAGGAGGLRKLLATFTPPEEPIPDDEREVELEKRLDSVRLGVGSGKWVAAIGVEREGRYPMTLEQRGGAIRLPGGVLVTVRPITLKQAFEHRAEPPMKGLVADFGLSSFEAITAFFAFRAEATVDGTSRSVEFVVTCAVEGAPEDRAGRILQAMLDTPEKFLKFIAILLSDDSVAAIDSLTDVVLGEGDGLAAQRRNGGPTLESLLRMLARDPRRIDAIEGVVREMMAPGSKSHLPSGFADMWEPIRAARATQRERTKS